MNTTIGENELRDLVLKHFTPTRHRLTYEQEGGDAVRVSADMLAFCDDFAAELRRKDGLGTVSVKPLEWVRRNDEAWDASSDVGDGYTVKARYNGQYIVFADKAFIDGEYFASADEAKAAAQSCLASIGVEAGK